VWPTFNTIIAVNAAVTVASHPSGREPGPDDLETVTRKTAEIGHATPAPVYMNAVHTAHRLGRQMAAFHRDWDVLLTPGLAVPPVELGWLDMMMDDVAEYWDRVAAFSPFTVWFNLTGQPAMMLPLGHLGTGLPIAVQAVAGYGCEATLFRLAAQLEAARPWIDRRPAVAAPL
jgi:Asp-tRNA(Asn)/Glu-tRNA(Gln) amidotransferase A subunit family amidase